MRAARARSGCPFKMLRERIPMLSAMTLDQLGAKMRCDKCGKLPERYYPANQSDTPGFVRIFYMRRNYLDGCSASGALSLLKVSGQLHFQLQTYSVDYRPVV